MPCSAGRSASWTSSSTDGRTGPLAPPESGAKLPQALKILAGTARDHFFGAQCEDKLRGWLGLASSARIVRPPSRLRARRPGSAPSATAAACPWSAARRGAGRRPRRSRRRRPATGARSDFGGHRGSACLARISAALRCMPLRPSRTQAPPGRGSRDAVGPSRLCRAFRRPLLGLLHEAQSRRLRLSVPRRHRGVSFSCASSARVGDGGETGRRSVPAVAPSLPISCGSAATPSGRGRPAVQ